ncbi:hypothetical protein HG536_0A00180 [Torulaspora globosa]|uniref:Uncharacterized protein n=1 Tax=Torulaspora globosa TaxID=48254 RepID=A0A7G3Z9L5_9SACH|nr:uncharacterized protein HG536_0A00180 [Torulaspora globosa]QLL30201.1 hypothetical protein HG536_0A00180 [Torulaspora globosa]
MKVDSKGKILLHFLNSRPCTVNALSSPDAELNDLSIDELAQKGYFPNFRKQYIENKNGTPVARILKKGPYYWLSSKYLALPSPERNHGNMNINTMRYSLDYIHRLFGM